jgi:transposase
MANKLISMSKVRKVIQLFSQGNSKVFISNYLSLSRNTVKKYITLYQLLNITAEEMKQKSDVELEALFSSNNEANLSPRLKKLYAFFPRVERDLKKTGVTRFSMWEEYIKKHPDGFRRTQFLEHYNRWNKKVNPVMHMTHKAGDKMFIDYAGKTLQVIDKETGEIQELQFFVAVLGASQHTYAESSPSQKKEDFIASIENALHYYKGVPAAIVPDNLRSAVTKSSRYEPTINETLLDFAEHYETTILPARAYKPRDKSLAEGAVKILYQRIYPILRKEEFYSIESLNKRIWELLEKHNNKKLTGRPYSRYQLFKEVEQDKLSPLPVTRFEVKYQAFATVIQNGHVILGVDKHYYSVPYQYIRKKVKLLYSGSTVEIYYKYNRIATHKRNLKPYHYTTVKEHLASTHRFITEWNPQQFIDQAASVNSSVEELICRILEHKQHPEQAYKSCMGVLAFEKKVGKERLTNACKRALEHKIYNYRTIQTILEKGLDKLIEDEAGNNELPKHKNIRGNNYFN